MRHPLGLVLQLGGSVLGHYAASSGVGSLLNVFGHWSGLDVQWTRPHQSEVANLNFKSSSALFILKETPLAGST